MKLLMVYTVLVIFGEAGAIGLGEVVGLSYPGASLFIFLALFFSVLLFAWPLALRVTRE